MKKDKEEKEAKWPVPGMILLAAFSGYRYRVVKATPNHIEAIRLDSGKKATIANNRHVYAEVKEC